MCHRLNLSTLFHWRREVERLPVNIRRQQPNRTPGMEQKHLLLNVHLSFNNTFCLTIKSVPRPCQCCNESTIATNTTLHRGLSLYRLLYGHAPKDSSCVFGLLDLFYIHQGRSRLAFIQHASHRQYHRYQIHCLFTTVFIVRKRCCPYVMTRRLMKIVPSWFTE